MSSAKPKPVAEINLEEFERRLRASAAPQASVEDPLAELTRLVDTIGFERSPSERALELSRPRPVAKPELRLAPPPPPPPAPEAPKPAPALVKAPAPRIEPPQTPPPLPPLEDTTPALRPSFEAEHTDSLAFEPPTPALAETGAAVELAPEPIAPRPPRARGWGLKVGGLIAAAAVMAGAVVVFKLGGQTHSGPPPLILASTTPTKVAPPSQVTVRTANETGALLTRDSAQSTPTQPKLVNPPEAPLDLAARPEPSPAASPTASATAPVASPAASPSASAEAEASPIAPSSNTPIVATAAPSAAPISPVGVDPSRVKTISVRPDGTIISQGYESATAPKLAPLSPPTPAHADQLATANADSEPASPSVALPTKLSPPKSAARVVEKTPTTAPADAGVGPVPVTPKPVKPKAPAAEAEPADDGADAAPAAASGGYAVQFAAPRNEGAAKALINRFQSRYADALGGAALGVRKAKRGSSSIYRVRAGGLSRAEANAMCAKVKAAGGDCFVAKN